jgi:hypothetical protein
MVVFVLSRFILLVGVKAGDSMCNAKRPKNGYGVFDTPTPIRLHTLNFYVKKMLNMSLKLHKDTLCLRSIMHEIDPCEFAKIINEPNIIFVTTNRNWCIPPYI